MLKPMNKYLVVNPIKEEEKQSGVLVPEEYSVDTSAFSLVTLRRSRLSYPLEPGTKLVVPTHMIEHIELFGEKHYVVLENHVVGFFDN